MSGAELVSALERAARALEADDPISAREAMAAAERAVASLQAAGRRPPAEDLARARALQAALQDAAQAAAGRLRAEMATASLSQRAQTAYRR